MTSYLNVVKALKVKGRYGGDAAMNEINVLDDNSMSAHTRHRGRTTKQAYIRVGLVVLKQVYRQKPSQQKRGINKDIFTLVSDYLLYRRSILV